MVTFLININFNLLLKAFILKINFLDYIPSVNKFLTLSLNLIFISISGPEYWGLINPEWSLCEKGKQQSPVDINPKSLVFDPNLKPLLFEGGRVSEQSFSSIYNLICCRFCFRQMRTFLR